MLKERFQELLDFIKTESPNRLANKGWINEDIYLRFGGSPNSDSKKLELAEISLLWSPINKLISSLFIVISFASILVFLLISLSSGKIDLDVFSSLFPEENSTLISFESKDTIIQTKQEGKEIKDLINRPLVKESETEYSLSPKDAESENSKTDLLEANLSDPLLTQKKLPEKPSLTVKRKSNLF